MSSPKTSAPRHDEESPARVEAELDSSYETLQLKNFSTNDAEESTPVPKSFKSGKCRKNDQCVQQALRTLNRFSTSEEKFTAICAKYADIFDENRKLQATSKEQQKLIATFTKEKDQARSELMKSIITKDKLENLCRELQRQNREIREESLQKMKEEEEKRKNVSTKFQTTLNEITELMKQDSDKTMKLRDDNVDMTSKLKSIYEQYEIREQQMERMTKQMALESQLYEAKIAKLEMEAATEKEVLVREKQQLLLTLTEYQARFQEYQSIEATLRNQVALYNNKYEEFEKSLTRSNEVFGGFKSEMENMSNKIVTLESETAAWKLRWEKTQKALIEMASEKQKSDQEIILAAKQIATLHKLCQTLQSERTQLLAKLKQSSSQNSTTENNSNNAGGGVLGTKINDENSRVGKNYAEEKEEKNKPKIQTKSSQPSEKSPSVPKTKSKTSKKQLISTPRNCIQNTTTEELNNTIAQIDVKEPLKTPDSLDKVVPPENSNSVLATEVFINDEKEITATQKMHQQKVTPLASSTDLSSPKDIKSEQKNEQSRLLSSKEEVKISTSLSENTSEPTECLLKDSVQSNKKKSPSKKKNKK